MAKNVDKQRAADLYNFIIVEKTDLLSLCEWLDSHRYSGTRYHLKRLIENGGRRYTRFHSPQGRAEYIYNWLKHSHNDLNDMADWLYKNRWVDTSVALRKLIADGEIATANTIKAKETIMTSKDLYLVTDVVTFSRGDKVLSPNPLVDENNGGIILRSTVGDVPEGWSVYTCHTWGKKYTVGDGVRVGRCVIKADVTDVVITKKYDQTKALSLYGNKLHDYLTTVSPTKEQVLALLRKCTLDCESTVISTNKKLIQEEWRWFVRSIIDLGLPTADRERYITILHEGIK